VEIKKVSINDVNLWKDNPRNIKTADFKRLKKQIEELGVYKPLIACPENGGYTILGGNMRLRALKDMGLKEVDISIVKPKSKAEKIKYALSDNDRVGEYMEDELAELVYPYMEEIDLGDYKIDLGEPASLEDLISDYGPDAEGEDDEVRMRLAEKFIVPPFSILDARLGDWQERKKAWVKLGIKGELGRDGNITNAPLSPNYIEGTCSHVAPGTSIFDPVLCEIMYRWFCPDGGSILDPFAGGAVRGVVASLLGYRYVGIELRQEQVDENEKQSKIINVNPKWIQGDSNNIEEIAKEEYDFIFSCPPYYNLEIYSNFKGELSAMDSYREFLSAYNNIVTKSVSMLKQDRFACFVVGDIREKKGFYRNFISDHF